MENRKFIKLSVLIPSLLTGFFILSANFAFAYSVDTHAFLTRELIEYYNKHFQQRQIPDDLKPYLIDGSRREDNPPRYLNHFYDPVNNRGLDTKLFKGESAKKWAISPSLQKKVIYALGARSPFSVISLLTSSQLEKVKPIFKSADFTWQRALRLYAEGKNEQAMYVLGHILHLIEDMAVPEHTRNDPHPPWDDGGSPYENWAKENKNLETSGRDLALRLADKTPIIFSELGEYFDSIAEYSNKNFYSRDSIGTYKLPEPDYFKNGFAIKTDDSGDYLLAKIINKPEQFYYILDTETDVGNNLTIIDTENSILSDYFNRLSVKAIQHGAGVINLFFKEAEIARAKYEREKAGRPYLGLLKAGFDAIFGGGSSNGDLVAEVKLSSGRPEPSSGRFTRIANHTGRNSLPAAEVKIAKDDRSAVLRDKKDFLTQKVKVEVQDKRLKGFQEEKSQPINKVEAKSKAQDSNKQDVKQNNKAEVEVVAAELCGFGPPTSLNPRIGPVIINEVAWMGSESDYNDEWIELKNISDNPVDISGWQLIDMKEQIKIIFKNKTTLLPGELLLLKRSQDYTGALSNVGEGLRLYNSSCDLQDEVLAAPDWPAGENIYKRTMERSPDLSWRHSSDPGGTPGKENSEGIAPASNYGGSSGSNSGSSESLSDDSNPNTEASKESTDSDAQSAPKILISEIQAGTEEAGSEDEFIELYNPTDQEINLTGWELRKRTSSGHESNLVDDGKFVGTIAPKSFFLIAHKNYKGPKVPDLRYSTDNDLAYSNNAVVLYDGDYRSANIVDEVEYTDIPKGKSIERKALDNDVCVSPQGGNELKGNGCDTDSQDDWEIREAPNPQNTDDLPEPRQAAVIQNFKGTYSAEGPALFFQWDPLNHKPLFYLYDMDQSTTTPVATTTDSSISIPISEVGREYHYKITSTDELGEAINAETTVYVPSFLTKVEVYENAMLLEWDKDAFIPDKFTSGEMKNWFMIAVNKNAEAVTDEYFGENSKWWGHKALSNSPALSYYTCNDGKKETGVKVLIIPKNEESCADKSTVSRRLAVNLGDNDDPRLRIDFADNLAAGDYLTFSFYDADFSQPDNPQHFVASDAAKYTVKEGVLENEPPTPPQDIRASYDAGQREIIVEWSMAKDPDGPDNLVKYEINYNGVWHNDVNSPYIIRGFGFGETATVKMRAVDVDGAVSTTTITEYTVPYPDYITDVSFSKDENGNYLAFTLDDDNSANNKNYSRYIMVWFNSDPAKISVENRNSGLYPDWAGTCEGSGYVGEGEPQDNPGTGFDHYVMPEYKLVPPAKIKPPVYDRSKAPYHYKIYFTSQCPNNGIVNGNDLTATMTPSDFITLGLWFYNAPQGVMDEDESVNYPERHYFAP